MWAVNRVDYPQKDTIEHLFDTLDEAIEYCENDNRFEYFIHNDDPDKIFRGFVLAGVSHYEIEQTC